MPTSGTFRPEQLRPVSPEQPPRTTEIQTPDLPEYAPETIETLPEQTRDQKQHEQINHTEGLMSRMRKPKVPVSTKPFVRDELTREVEAIMSEGMVEAYKALSPVKQQEFKIKGEETAQEIRALLLSTKVKVKKIFELLFDWLKLLPGVNKFFLEQEAKIKAERIVRLKELRNFRP